MWILRNRLDLPLLQRLVGGIGGVPGAGGLQAPPRPPLFGIHRPVALCGTGMDKKEELSDDDDKGKTMNFLLDNLKKIKWCFS